MKFFITIILLITIVSVTLGALSRTNTPDPDNPGNCLVGGVSFTPGMHRNPSPTKCRRIDCHEGGNAVIATCGVQRRQGCIKEGYIDISLPYPECCAIKWSCPEN